MLVPFISDTDASRTARKRKLERRKGGGGKGGKGGGSSTGKGGSSGSGSSGSSGSRGTKSSVPISGSVATRKSATSYGSGGGKAITIPSGQLFAGRTAGGGTRAQTFGGQRYGSGYPGLGNNGVAGRGFPFFFWPVVWGGALGAGNAHYLNGREYGDERNTSRPGGPMFQATFASNSSNSTFHVIADNSTAVSLSGSITANCSSFVSTSNSSTTPSAYNSTAPGAPNPVQAVQYYRASSVVLTLDGYNDTAALSDDNTTANTPLPSSVDHNLLDCLNQTIGLAVPLINGASSQWTHSATGMGLMGLVWTMWLLFATVA
ncbi:hypothetical protein PUNSTDRAFT_68982 [Punctularia strigosozonata HHB-11173 SS5]|uniref:uncharacterized protein n=1 Tax=Punctularia strigosozonata (strain HHB-11173) TaxID=741275 RepID=UPI0004416625|nr:uncharacterized protein PUNSTDRAFT_68982 [Punctularia strigosozonata HHB-11173 SS5]EIN08255.1 hypothetical protein PUNSTDRAFT_68982 [Punctularia strigosozonata HHB-11173 SS5]